MTHVIGSRTLIRVLVALMMLSIGATAAIMPASPARAGDSFPPGGLLLRSGEVVCVENVGGIRPPRIRCFVLPVWIREPRPDPPCRVCDALGFEFMKGFPVERQVAVVGSLSAGFDLLLEAALATDPEQVATLRSAALERFADAAVVVAASDPDGDPVAPVTGYVDPKTGAFERAEVPALAGAGAAIVDGLAALDPDPDPVDPILGQELFDKAFGLLTGPAGG